MHILRRHRLLPVLLTLLTGCNGVLQGAPVFDIGLVTAPSFAPTFPPAVPVVPKDIPQACIDAINAASDTVHRDACIEIMMGQIDISYYGYRKSLLAAVNDSNALTDIATIGLSTAGTLVPGATAKSILAGIVTGINGSKQAINADVLYNQSIMSIIATMETDRKSQEHTIRAEMNREPANDKPAKNNPVRAGPTPQATAEATLINPATKTKTTITETTKTTTSTGSQTTTIKKTIPEYTIYMAARDLQQYYEAGTYTHALITLAGDAGTKLTNCRKALKKQKTAQPNPADELGAPGGLCP